MNRDDFRFFTSSKVGDNLLAFLRDFDPISEKYAVDRMETRKLNFSQYAEASKFESSQQFGQINKNKYSDILKNLKQVYDNEDIVHSDVVSYHYVEKNIIHRYLNIPQLDKMFDEDYFEFEWDMHIEQNFAKHTSQYYRDHFIHQIRNYYMMYVLLKHFGFEAAIREIFNDQRENNIIARYVRGKESSFLCDEHAPIIDVLNKICDDVSWNGYRKEDYHKDYFYSYVIMASAALAALFHDMGYPICHFLSVRQRTSSYNPTMYMFTHNAIDSFDELASKLSASLLFTVEAPRVIQERLRYNSKKKSYDHGVYSAIAFLLQFYDNGLIFSLSPEKQCAIEMAALAIFNHTGKFRAIDEDNTIRHQTMVFKQNPISFLLRFCDDLQEWDRQYFEISKASDLLFCEKCGTPLIRKGSDSVSKKSIYQCCCSSGKSGNSDMIRPDIFIKRKLLLVSVADSVRFHKKEGKLQATIDYDYYRLLLLSKINPTYAGHRDHENGGIRRLLINQDFLKQGKGKLDFRYIDIDYFVSANPILIKVKILEKYLALTDADALNRLNEVGVRKNKKGTRRRIEILAEKIINEVFEDNPPKYFKKSSNKNIVKTISFYIILLICMRANVKEISSSEMFEEYITKDKFYDEMMDRLVTDCVNRYNDTKKSRDLPICYIESYTDEELRHNKYDPALLARRRKNKKPADTISLSEKAVEKETGGNFYIGYYQDIYLFYRMNELLNRRKKQSKI